MTELDHLTLGSRVAGHLGVTPEDYPLTYGIVSRALGLEDLPLGIIPGDATFTLRRDVEYLPEVFASGYSPTYAAPYGLGGSYPKVLRDLDPLFSPEDGNLYRGYGWKMSGDEDDNPEPIESDWVGAEQYVYAYRWDWSGVSVRELEDLARLNDWDAEYGEPLGGYLDEFGIHPAMSFTLEGMDFNIGGITPVFVAQDYVVLD